MLNLLRSEAEIGPLSDLPNAIRGTASRQFSLFQHARRDLRRDDPESPK